MVTGKKVLFTSLRMSLQLPADGASAFCRHTIVIVIFGVHQKESPTCRLMSNDRYILPKIGKVLKFHISAPTRPTATERTDPLK